MPSPSSPGPSALLRELDAATRAGDLEAVLGALARGADPNHPPPYGGETVLMVAAQDSRLDIARALLDAGADPCAVVNVQGEQHCPLSWALDPASKTAGEMAGLLFSKGADPWVMLKRRWGSAWRPVDKAIEGRRRHALAAWAVAGLDPRAKAPHGGLSVHERLKAAQMPGLIDVLDGALAGRQKEELAQACAPAQPSAKPWVRRV